MLFSEDTAMTWVAEQLASRTSLRRLDVALLPMGYAPWWKRYFFRRGHLTPGDALALFSQIDARIFITFHWGTFRHITAGAYDAIDALRKLLLTHARRAEVKILVPGETLYLSDVA